MNEFMRQWLKGAAAIGSLGLVVLVCWAAAENKIPGWIGWGLVVLFGLAVVIFIPAGLGAIIESDGDE